MKNFTNADLFSGVLYALIAGLMWGLAFVAPALLSDYSSASLAFGRYVMFGLISLMLCYADRQRLLALRRVDWLEAFKLAFIGNLLYYLFAAAAIQMIGVALVSVLIGTLPVLIAICANWHDRHLPWAKLVPSLILILIGIALVNHSEWLRFQSNLNLNNQELLNAANEVNHVNRIHNHNINHVDYLYSTHFVSENLQKYLIGVFFTLIGLAAWTWYPIRNARWLQKHPSLSASTWTIAQGLATFPMAVLGWLIYSVFFQASLPESASFLGSRPLYFLGLIFALGFFASWLGTLTWSYASQRLPTSLTGQLIVFETLSALFYGFLQRHQLPDRFITLGIVFLIAGVILGVRSFQSLQRHE